MPAERRSAEFLDADVAGNSRRRAARLRVPRRMSLMTTRVCVCVCVAVSDLLKKSCNRFFCGHMSSLLLAAAASLSSSFCF